MSAPAHHPDQERRGDHDRPRHQLGLPGQRVLGLELRRRAVALLQSMTAEDRQGVLHHVLVAQSYDDLLHLWAGVLAEKNGGGPLYTSTGRAASVLPAEAEQTTRGVDTHPAPRAVNHDGRKDAAMHHNGGDGGSSGGGFGGDGSSGG